MEKKAMVIIGVTAVVVVVIFFAGTVYASGAQLAGQGIRSGGMMHKSGAGGTMMGSGARYPGSMMAGGMGEECASYMQQYLNSTSP